MTDPGYELQVAAIQWEADGVLSVELIDPAGKPLTAFTAGSHIDLHLANGLIRQYSLCNDPAEQHRYLIAVGLDPASRGGSRYIHEKLLVGQRLTVTGPRNHFPLAEQAEQHVLIAGGIGITPLLAMFRKLCADGQPCHLYYAVRDASRCAFASQIDALHGTFSLHIDAEHGAPIDLQAIVATHPEAHFYCCGPAPMLKAFETATASLPPARVHVEYFAAKPVATDAVAEHSFDVECRASGITVHIDSGQSIVQALEVAGIRVDTSCQEGICGTCETRVLEGLPLHLDSVLTASERAANRSMMICISRCMGSRLVLDL